MRKIFDVIDLVGKKEIEFIKKVIEKARLKIPTFCNRLCSTINKINFFNEKRNLKVGSISLLIIIALTLSIASLFQGRTLNNAINKYVESQMKIDAELLFELIPDELIQILEQKFINDNPGIMISEVRERMVIDVNVKNSDEKERLIKKYGAGWDYSYTIGDKHSLTGDEIEEIDAKYSYANIDHIKEAQSVEILIEFINGGKKVGDDRMFVTFIKIGRDWYYDFM